PALRALLPLFNVAGLVLVAKRRQLLRTLRAATADTVDRAIPLMESGLASWWVKRLTTAGVLQQTPEGLYWLDRKAYGRYRQVRLMRVLVVLTLAAGLWIAWTTT
ncbi:MAG: hypothetical protein ABIP90_07770, partial [Vicinamibacterales bacterium]